MKNERTNPDMVEQIVLILSRYLYLLFVNTNIYDLCVKCLVVDSRNTVSGKSYTRMNEHNPLNPIYFGFKPLFKTIVCLFAISLISVQAINAQCPTGASTATLKWDNREYLYSNGTIPYYPSTYVTSAMIKSQNFSIGRNIVNIYMTSGSITSTGVNTTNTATSGSYGSGNAIAYTGNGTITLTFDSIVNNVKFSLYDIDASQTATITAKDGLGIATAVTMSVVTSGNVTVLGSGTVIASATALASSVSNSSTKGTLNISIPGSSTNGVKSVSIAIGGTAGDFWFSDIAACVYQSFPNNYFAVAKPYNGQPSYVVANSTSNNISYVDPATGKAKNMFQDASLSYENNLGYDPYQHYVYYCADGNTNAATIAANKSVKKYDYNTGTITTVIANVNTLGIPTFNQGIELGGGAFYDGAYYLGIEGSGPDKDNNASSAKRKSMVWRIDFDASGNAIKASQVYAYLADDGAGNTIHDWGDFDLKDGLLIDFNSSSNGPNFVHYSLQSGLIVNTYTPTGGQTTPRQVTQTWDGSLYWLDDKIAPYAAGVVGTKVNVTGATSADWNSNARDGGEAFKPKVDFGDAPASYDPTSGDPAVHEIDSKLRLGANEDIEWNFRGQTTQADQDNYDDGLGAAPSLLNFGGTTNYSIQVNVFNNTGSNATVIAWLDYNFNGVFDAGEGRSVTVNNSGSTQLVTINWNSITVPTSSLLRTYLRIRVTSASNGMTTSDATGYFANGEVEDYPVVLGMNLPVDFLAFDLSKNSGAATVLNWTITGNVNELSNFNVERSVNGLDWSTIASVASNNSTTNTSYSYTDKTAAEGKLYYRIKLNAVGGTVKYSTVKSTYNTDISQSVVVYPNPAVDRATVKFNVTAASSGNIAIIDNKGQLVSMQNIAVTAGNNQVNLQSLDRLASGIYILRLDAGNAHANVKLIIRKN
ncbi:MAG: GEVED domain-containing protein [Chitinophagaceae bacterium]